MRAFGDFARLDLVQCVDPLPISINGVHEMHAVRRNVSDLIERFARGHTLVCTPATEEWVNGYGITGKKFE